MKFTFIGDGDSDPDEIELWGLVFPLGQAVDVTDAHAIKKLRGNANFKEGEAEPAKPKPKPRPMPTKGGKTAKHVQQVDVPDDD